MIKKLKQNRGFSIAEVVIAMSVVVIVSMTALTIVLSSTTAKNKAIAKNDALNFAANVVECFKAADSKDEFIKYVTFGTEVTLTNEDNSGTYSVDINGCNVTIDYAESNLTVVIKDVDTITYTK